MSTRLGVETLNILGRYRNPVILRSRLTLQGEFVIMCLPSLTISYVGGNYTYNALNDTFS